MSPTNETAAPATAEDSTLYVAIEIRGKSWMVGVKRPASERVGLPSASNVVTITTTAVR